MFDNFRKVSVHPKTSRARHPPLHSEDEECKPSIEKWHPFRAVFDYTFIKDLVAPQESEDTKKSTIDPYRCYTVNSYVRRYDFDNSKWEEKYQCKETDLLTQPQIDNIINTCERIKPYLSSLLQSVVRDSGPITLLPSYLYGFPISSPSFSNGDCHMTILAHPIGQHSLISYPTNFSIDFIPGTENIKCFCGVRQAFLAFNPQYVDPEDTSDYGQRRQLAKFLRHIFPMLGFSVPLSEYWRSPISFCNYTEETRTKTITFQGRNVPSVILNTPTVHEVIVQRTGVEEFKGKDGEVILSGAELEDQPGYEDYFEMRTFKYELMSPHLEEQVYISNLTLAVLQDTGWYKVNFSMAEEYPYGDIRFTNPTGKPSTFLTGKPQDSFPPHYFPEKNVAGDTLGCSFDFHLGGLWYLDECSPECDNYFPYEFDGKKYGTDIIESDYTPLVIPHDSRICFREWNSTYPSPEVMEFYGLHFGRNSYCATLSNKANTKTDKLQNFPPGCYEMDCKGEDLFVTIRGKKTQCKRNQKISISDIIDMNCPDPALICKIIHMDKKKYQVPSNLDEDNSFWAQLQAKGISKGGFGVLVGLGVLIFAGITCLLVWLVIRKKRNWGNEEVRMIEG